MVKAQRIDGADLSHWQGGERNFAAAKHAGVRFVVHKATQGTGYTDPNFHMRATQVRGAGLVFGAYHFADPAGSPAAQAAHFLAVAKPTHGDLRPMLDFEDAGFASWSTARKTDFVRTFVAAVKNATGAEPFVYLPGTWALSDNFDCPLWVPRYSNSNSSPRIPRPWKTWTVWQFSDGAYGVPRSVAGLGNVDLNTVNMAPADFLATFTLGAKKEAPVKQSGQKTQKLPPKKTPTKPRDPQRARTVRVYAANLDFATPAAKDSDHLRHLIGTPTSDKPVIVLAQEAKNLRGTNSITRLLARLAAKVARIGTRGTAEVHQDTSTSAKAGTAILSYGVKVSGWRLWLAGKSRATLARWVRQGRITLNGRTVVVISAHVFPKRSGAKAQAAYVAKLKRHVQRARRRGYPVILGADFNEPGAGVAKVLGGRFYGSGIVGLVVVGDVTVRGHGVDGYGERQGETDHPAAWVEVS